MEKIYNPQCIEQILYEFWEKNGYFKPNNNLNKPSFCIMMPPPNVTGNLHMGHAFQQTIMDILIRYNRMQGKNTLWQVGTDHAGIATQILVEQNLFKKEKKTKNDYSRNEFIKQVWIWKKKYHNIISKQMRRIGVSVDWEKEKFTLDPDISFAVQEAFIIFYKNQLIYQKKRLVNWDIKLETVISDLEVEHRSINGEKWHIKYPILEKNKNIIKYLLVETTRPETLLGDTAIAINPKDFRYNKLLGKYVIVPIVNRIVPIIADKHAKITQGTGCVKITPAHDFNDYKVSLRHKLPIINVFNLHGKIKKQFNVYNYKGEKSNIYDSSVPLDLQNLSILSARMKIVEKIQALGLLKKIEKCQIIVPYSERSGVVVLPMLTNQWYLKTSKLANIAIDAVKTKKISFIPNQYENMYLSWMNNIEDWCISRQLWWGHRIPIWYDNNKNIYVGRSEKEIRYKHNINKKIFLKQEKDVLDTWFSSGLWTFSTLGWPKKNKLLNIFHPTNVLVSGFDIIFFWIARMIMLTMYLVKDKDKKPNIPFKDVYITGLIRDEYGQKMSKSKGNIIDPLDMIDGISLDNLINKRIKNLMLPSLKSKIKLRTIKQFPKGIAPTGTDALRFTFASLSSNTRDINWDINRLKGYRNFCNKLWNASRFTLIHTKAHDFSAIDINQEYLLFNKWILIEFNNVVKLYRESLDNYRFDIASNTLYDFTWNTFCDWYLECVKSIIKIGSSIEVLETKNVLIHVLELLLRLAHPIIPFITEEIWQRIKLIKKIKKDTIMLQSFPKYNKKICNVEILKNMYWIKKVIMFFRNVRKNMNVHSSKLLTVFFYNVNYDKEMIIKKYLFFLKNIANLKNIKIFSDKHKNHDLSIKTTINEIDIVIPILQVVDKKNEIERLKREINKTELLIEKIKKNLSNEKFLLYAPKNVVKQENRKLIKLIQTNENFYDQIKIFKNLV